MGITTHKRNQMHEYVSIAFSACLSILSFACIALALACHGGRVVGIENAEVLSGSMEPEIATGSLAYFNTEVDCPNLAEGQIVAFQIDEQTQVIHRIVRNDITKKQLYTKGDANTAQDPQPVPYENVNGVVLGSVPYLGKLVNGIHDALPDLTSLPFSGIS